MHPLHALAAYFLLLLGPLTPALAGEFPYEARVRVPVADLRAKPSDPRPSRDHDPLEESQLLYGEPVQVLEEKEGWARVEALEQQEWSHHKRWEGYPGWLRLSDIARTGVAPRSIPEQKAGREEILRQARQFLGLPYYWGGRSFPDPSAKEPPHRGVDCSGLTGLAYQNGGREIPRDAHEQWMKAKPLQRDELQPADLVFLSDPKEGRRVTHVMLYAGGGRVIEAPGTGENVRETELDTRLEEARAEGRKIYYGSYLADHGSTSSP